MSVKQNDVILEDMYQDFQMASEKKDVEMQKSIIKHLQFSGFEKEAKDLKKYL